MPLVYHDPLLKLIETSEGNDVTYWLAELEAQGRMDLICDPKVWSSLGQSTGKGALPTYWPGGKCQYVMMMAHISKRKLTRNPMILA